MSSTALFNMLEAWEMSSVFLDIKDMTYGILMIHI